MLQNIGESTWNYFDWLKIKDTIFGFYKFEKCSQKISWPTSSTTGLFTHLRSYHKKESAECDKKAQEPRGSGISRARRLVASLERRFPFFDEVQSDVVCAMVDPWYKSLYCKEPEKLAANLSELRELFNELPTIPGLGPKLVQSQHSVTEYTLETQLTGLWDVY
ncbi:uncharacterized protein LOC136080761 [Hydra vulgaris]|uniref:Uncharacterized protein LOC136080761 n=1 Tax=Hydra vulgaris TaxID=6087 RepID=A0ABM4BXG3_HYDVU